MLICYLRSSSLGTLEFCENKYFLSYTLGYKDKDNVKALAGSTMHKNLELLGRVKLAQDKNRKTFVDEEFGRIKLSKCTLEYLNDLSFNYYQKHFPILTNDYRKKCLEWTYRAIEYRGGELDPRNQDVLNVEEYFDITIDKEWARYDYTVGDRQISGQLSIKGTVDLIMFEDEDTIHVLDYKSGRRFNWATETVKDYKSLQKDQQLLFYYYALRNRYPTKQILVSIYYVNDHTIDKVLVKGGLFTMAFGDEEYAISEAMIRRKFEGIRNTTKPKLLNSKCAHFKCKYMCAFSKPIDEIDPSKPACLAIKEQIDDKGIDWVTEKYANLDKIASYSSGGGRLSDEDRKD